MIKNIFIVVVGLALIAALYAFIKPSLPHLGAPVACTMEAKLCPDGSSVGRTGPNCEFAQCPGGDAAPVKPAPGQVMFQCAGGKSITATFKDKAVEFYVSDGRSLTFNLKQVPTDNTGAVEAKYASDDGKTVLWVSEQSAFLEENGKTTFSACVLAPAEFPNIDASSEPPLPN